MLACTVWLTSLRPDPAGPRRLPLPPFVTIDTSTCVHRCTRISSRLMINTRTSVFITISYPIHASYALPRAAARRQPERADPPTVPPAPHAPHATPISSSALPSIHMAPYFPHVIFSVALRPFPRLSPPLSVLAPCLAPGPHRATVVTTTTVTVVTVVTVAPAAAEDPAMIVTRTKTPSVDGAPAPVLIPISPSR